MRLEFKVDVREPYMGNQVPLSIVVVKDREGEWKLMVTNPEGIVHHAKLVSETHSIIEQLPGIGDCG